MATIETNGPVKARVGFGANHVGLYLFPADQKTAFLKRHLALEMPRDGSLGEDDQNVQYVRRLAGGINDAGEFIYGREQVSA